MREWWDSLETAAKIFAYIAIPATVLLAVQIIMSLIGFGHDGGDIDGDMGDFDGDGNVDYHDMHHGDGMRLFSVRGIVAFLAVLGWTGLTMLKSSAGLWVAIPVSVAAGAAAMLIIAYLFRLFFKLQSDGTANISNAVGASGSVYLTIPALRAEKGKISIMLQGRLSEIEAVTDDSKPIASGAEIEVTGVADQNTLIVKRKN